MAQVTISFANQEHVTFEADANMTILEASERAGIPLAHDCRSGICRTCAGRSASDEELLLCSIRPQEDIAVRVPYDRAQVLRPVFRRAKITALSLLSPGVWHLSCRLQFPLTFLPGQYVRLSPPGSVEQRCFSMANAPRSGIYEFYIRALPSGIISDYLRSSAKVGDIISLRGPSGAFYLHERAAPKLFIAGGTGLAPILSMLSVLHEQRFDRSVYLAYGVTHARDAFGEESLRDLSQDMSLIAKVAAVYHGEGWDGTTGTVVDALSAITFAEPAECLDVYICGPMPMVNAAKSWLAGRGFSLDRIYNETFLPS
nr:2Fe-2S iron-sulfur cluster binding domain-containing protein [uncultured Dongia sp.]